MILPLAFGLVSESIGWITGIGIGLSKKTYLRAVSYFVGLAVTGLSVWIFIGLLGIVGAAYGIMTGRIVQAVTYTLLAYRVYPLRFSLKVPALVFILAISMGVAMQAAQFSSIIHTGIFRTALLGMFVLVIWRSALSHGDKWILASKLKALISIVR